MKNPKKTKVVKENAIRRCPKCGMQLVPHVLLNETVLTRQMLYLGRTYNVEGDAFDRITGEKLYRVEMDCPNEDTKGWIFKKKVSHYGIYAEEGLTKEQVISKYGIQP